MNTRLDPRSRLDPQSSQLDPKAWYRRSVADAAATASPARPRSLGPLDPRLVAIGLAGGLLSGLLGVGGGVVMVPLLVLWAGYDQRDAHATSIGAIVPISIAGILTFGLAGHVHWVDAAALAVGAVVGARVGAAWLARIDERVLRIVFGIFLVAVGVAMGIRS